MQENSLIHISLGIDARMLFSSGIGTVLQNLIPRFSKMGFALTLLVKEEDLEKIPILGNTKVIPMKSSIYSIKEQLEFYRKIPKMDLFWSPHYNIPLLPIRAKNRFVTIHDVCHLAMKDAFSPMQRFYAKTMLKKAIDKSDLVIVSSHFTHREIKRHLNKEDGKINVIHLGVDDDHFSPDFSPIDEEAKQALHLPDQYFLFVGNLKPHKNLSLLIKAFEETANRLQSDLVIVGANKDMIVTDQKSLKMAMESPHRNRIHFLGKVDQIFLPSIYRLSKALVFPSLYEGFGFPALEAMQCGTLVLASKIGALEEVCGDSALYFDPHDVESLKNLLIKVDSLEEEKNKILHLSKKRLSYFNWEKTAINYANKMKELF